MPPIDICSHQRLCNLLSILYFILYEVVKNSVYFFIFGREKRGVRSIKTKFGDVVDNTEFVTYTSHVKLKLILPIYR